MVHHTSRFDAGCCRWNAHIFKRISPCLWLPPLGSVDGAGDLLPCTSHPRCCHTLITPHHPPTTPLLCTALTSPCRPLRRRRTARRNKYYRGGTYPMRGHAIPPRT